jgi:pimeloyl-ACP methyl ester carboxylesterase
MELEVGDLVFEARADGPSEGELVLLLHGFPQTSLSWRHQLDALAAAGYHAVAPDQRGYSPGARPADVGEYRGDRLVGDVLASPTPSASSGSTSSATTGAARWRGRWRAAIPSGSAR